MARKLFSNEKGFNKKLLACTVVGLIFISLYLLLPQFFAPITRLLDYSFDPLMKIGDVSQQVKQSAQQTLRPKKDIIKENSTLKTEISINQALLQQLAAIKLENQQLKQWLKLDNTRTFTPFMVEVIGFNNNGELSLILGKGKNDGLSIGQMVVDAKGVMGQVTAVYPQSARLLLIADSSHSLSVRNLRTGQVSIASGTGNFQRLALDFVPNTTDVKVGDMYITAGIGSRFYPGFPVGVVKSIKVHGKTEFNDVELTPLAALNASNYLAVINEQNKGIAQKYLNAYAPAITLTQSAAQAPLETLPQQQTSLTTPPSSATTQVVAPQTSNNVSPSTALTAVVPTSSPPPNTPITPSSSGATSAEHTTQVGQQRLSTATLPPTSVTTPSNNTPRP